MLDNNLVSTIFFIDYLLLLKCMNKIFVITVKGFDLLPRVLEVRMILLRR